MEVSGEGASVYAEAKGEYTRQLCQYIVPAIHSYFLEMLTTAKQQEADTNKQLLQFQTLMEGIPEWNIDKVQRETQRILISTQCDYIEELLTAVFIAHTKVLSAIRLTNKQKKLQITIPKLEHFLHRTLKECARLLWTNTFLFSESYSPLERQKNMRQVEGLVSEGVLQGVRSMLPVKSILREYLTTEDTESEYESETEEESEEEEEKEMEKEVHVEKPKKNIVTAVKDTEGSEDSNPKEPLEPLKSLEPPPTPLRSTTPPPTPLRSTTPPPTPLRNTTPHDSPKNRPVNLPASEPAILNLDFEKPTVHFAETTTKFDATADAKPESAEVDTDDIDFEDVEDNRASKNEESENLEFDFETLA
jgi:hypothetical protein